jgi:hypothetical protein
LSLDPLLWQLMHPHICLSVSVSLSLSLSLSHTHSFAVCIRRWRGSHSSRYAFESHTRCRNRLGRGGWTRCCSSYAISSVQCCLLSSSSPPPLSQRRTSSFFSARTCIFSVICRSVIAAHPLPLSPPFLSFAPRASSCAPLCVYSLCISSSFVGGGVAGAAGKRYFVFAMKSVIINRTKSPLLIVCVSLSVCVCLPLFPCLSVDGGCTEGGQS